MKSAICKSPLGRNEVEVATPDILSCTAARAFWISWQDGRMQVGRGAVVGVNTFMQCLRDLTEPVKAASLSMGSAADVGDWQLDDPYGESSFSLKKRPSLKSSDDEKAARNHPHTPTRARAARNTCNDIGLSLQAKL